MVTGGKIDNPDFNAVAGTLTHDARSMDNASIPDGDPKSIQFAFASVEHPAFDPETRAGFGPSVGRTFMARDGQLSARDV